MVTNPVLPSLFPGTPSWTDSDSAALREFLVSPVGQRFSRRMLFERPDVSARAGEERRVQQDERTGFEAALRSVFDLADPSHRWDEQEAERRASVSS